MLEELIAEHAPALELHFGYIARTADGELFLAGGGHDTFLYKTGRKEVPSWCFGIFDLNLKTRRVYAERRGIRYVHAVVPDKESVATQSLPEALKLNSLIDMYRARTSEPFVDLRPDTPVPGYFCKVDTHWAIPGQIDAAARIARAFGISEDEITVATARLKASVAQDTVEVHGDLGNRFDPPQTEFQPGFDNGWTTVFACNPVGVWNDGKLEIYQSPSSPPRRLLILGDSFMHIGARMLTPFFSTILFCRSEFFHREIVDMMQPTHILTEQVERFLEKIESDTRARRFLLIPFVNGTEFKPTQDFWKELNAVLSPPPRDEGRGWRQLVKRLIGRR